MTKNFKKAAQITVLAITLLAAGCSKYEKSVTNMEDEPHSSFRGIVLDEPAAQE